MSDVTVSFGAKDDGLKAAIAGVEKGIGKMSSAFSVLVVAAVGIAAVKSAFDGFKKLADYAGGVSDLAAQTGLTAEATMVWTQALKNAGQDAGALGPLMNKLQKAMSGVNEDGEVTNKAFEKLGINVETLRALSPDQYLQTVAEAIGAIKDPAERAALAVELLGKSGGKSLAVFTDSSALSTAREQLGELATNLGSNIASLDKLSDAINAAGENKSLQFMAGFAKAFSGDLESAANTLNKMDFSKPGEDLGLMARGAKAIADDLARAANTGKGSFEAAGPAFMAALKSAVPLLGAGELLKNALGATGSALKSRGEQANAAGKDPLAGKSEENPAKETGDALTEANAAMQDVLASASTLKLEGLGPIPELLERGVDLLADQGIELNHNLDLYKVQGELAETLKQTEEQRQRAAESGAEAEISALREAALLTLDLEEAIASGNIEEAKRLKYIEDYRDALKQAKALGVVDPFDFAKRKADAASSDGEKTERRKKNKVRGPSYPGTTGIDDAIGETDFEKLQKRPSIKDRMKGKSAFEKLQEKPSIKENMMKGMEDKVPSGDQKKSADDSLSSIVKAIQTTLDKIEPRLPTPALAP